MCYVCIRKHYGKGARRPSYHLEWVWIDGQPYEVSQKWDTKYYYSEEEILEAENAGFCVPTVFDQEQFPGSKHYFNVKLEWCARFKGSKRAAKRLRKECLEARIFHLN